MKITYINGIIRQEGKELSVSELVSETNRLLTHHETTLAITKMIAATGGSATHIIELYKAFKARQSLR